MSIKFHRTDEAPFGYITQGYWRWDKPKNKGTLHIYVRKMSDWRFEAAVWGHELLEVFYCWLRGITTDQADEFDKSYEKGYADGSIPLTNEPGDDPKCCYHWGHMAGVLWEYICIYGTFASWAKYEAECNRQMGIMMAQTEPKRFSSSLP